MFIQAALPCVIRRGEEDFGFQGMGDVLMRGKLLSVVERDGVHEVADRLEATTAAFCVARAVARGNLMILDNWVLRSTSVSKPPLCPAPTTVSPSQSPKRVLRATMAGRSEMSILLGIRPRPAFLPARLL